MFKKLDPFWYLWMVCVALLVAHVITTRRHDAEIAELHDRTNSLAKGYFDLREEVAEEFDNTKESLTAIAKRTAAQPKKAVVASKKKVAPKKAVA